MICPLEHLRRHVQRPATFQILNSVVDAFEVLVDQRLNFDWLIYPLIFGLEVCGCDIYILVKYMLKEIVAHDYKEPGVLVF